MAVAILIGLWIYDEMTFNQYHENHHRIARILRNGTMNGETFTSTYLPYALPDELRTKYGSNFKNVLTASLVNDHVLSTGTQKFPQRGEFMEENGPEMFTLKMISGTHAGLKDPNSILLSASAAKTFFGDEDPMDKLMVIDSRMNVKVTGVYEDLPNNSHFFDVKFFAPWDLFVTHNSWMTSQGFANNFLDIYVEIQPSADFVKASGNIIDAILKNISEHKEYVAANPQIFLHPMDKWHLYAEWKNGVNTGGRIQMVWLFGTIGVFVLLLACINFMNLSTARSEKRAKEVGIRKAIGSVRTQLINQFLSESFLVVILAFFFAMVITGLSLGWFNMLAGKQMAMPFTNFYFWIISFSFVLITGVVAGSYPAFYLSSFLPVKVLKGTFRAGRFASMPRKVLVVLQFTVSVTLVIGTIVVYQQIQFAKNRPVGYNRDGLLLIQMTTPDFFGKYEVLRDKLKNTGAVEEMSQSAGPITAVWSSQGGFKWKGKSPEQQAEFATLSVTSGYGKTVGWQFVDGRDFSSEFATDVSGFVITEGAAKLMNLENPVGEIVHWEPGWRKGDDFKILGVIKDMVMESPYSTPMPTIFFLADYVSWINVKINPEVSTSDALPKIEAVFKEMMPDVPLDYKFADQEYALKFAYEERVGKLASVFACLAILISCLGLFGLASFTAEQRTKEIGIRKVVGASVFSLCKMLSKDFVVLVIIASVVSVPIAFYFLQDWLQKYQYRTEISWWIFAVVGMGAVIITLLTVTYQAMKAALLSPVKSLRSE
jgi:hypothetical protein